MAALLLLALPGSTRPVSGAAGGPIYPGCGASLQSCINAAPWGGTIEIASGFVNESVYIGKSLTLRGYPGYRPILRGVHVQDPPAGTTLTVLVERLAVTSSVTTGLTVAPAAGTVHAVTVRDVTVEQEAQVTGAGSAGISFRTNVPARFAAVGNTIHIASAHAAGIEFFPRLPSGSASMRAVGNRISQHGSMDGYSGVSMRLEGSATYRIDVLNNVIWDVMGCYCGTGGGIGLYTEGGVTADVNIVGNTVERSRAFGISVDNRSEAPATTTIDLFNNLITNSVAHGVVLLSDDPATFQLRADYNNLYGNGQPDLLGGWSLGASTTRLDPRYVDAARGDLRLRRVSPLIDRGQVCSPGGVANPDARGDHRVAGSGVDIGAYEWRSEPVTGVVLIGNGTSTTLNGTSGDDIICGSAIGERISGGAGVDILHGLGGPDVVIGGLDPDRLYGGAGGDRLCSRDGTGGNDHVNGGGGRDLYQADSGDVTVGVEATGTCSP